jgi:hypothetical protein
MTDQLPLIRPVVRLVQSGHADAAAFDTNELVGVQCPACHHEKQLHPNVLRGMLGCNVKCQACGQRALVPDDIEFEAPA